LSYIKPKIGTPCQGYDCKCKENPNMAKHTHHRDGNHKNNNPDNLIYLCVSCHRKEHIDYYDDDNPLIRSRDLCDDLQKQKIGYRLTAGFNMMNGNSFNE